MRGLTVVMLLVAGGALLGCESTADKADESQPTEEQASMPNANPDPDDQRRMLRQQYNDCINSARGDANKLRECDVYLDKLKKLL